MTHKSIATAHGELSVAFDGAAGADTVIVLGHGAGGPLGSDYMEFFAHELSGKDVRVVRFNFAYMERGRRAPDKQPVLEATFREVVDQVIGDAARTVLGGKSMGGRIASHVVAAGFPAAGLVFLGYPLHPPGRPERIRDEHLRAVSCPMLFVEGTRDPFCPLDTLERVTGKLSAKAEVVVINDGDHSLKVRKSSGRSTLDAWGEAAEAIRAWLARI